jgi:hypothetical protein
MTPLQRTAMSSSITALAGILALTLALPLAAVTSDAASAQSRTKARKPAYPQRKPVYDDRSAWYPNNADKLKIGSRIWWDQMAREGRIGGGGGDFRR